MEYHKDKDPLEAFFRQHLEGYAEEPPAEALDHIQQRLALRKRKRWGWFGWAGLLLLGLAAVGGTFVWENRQAERIKGLEQRLAAIQGEKLPQKAGENEQGSTMATSKEQPDIAEDNNTVSMAGHSPKTTADSPIFKLNQNSRSIISEGKKTQEPTPKPFIQTIEKQQVAGIEHSEGAGNSQPLYVQAPDGLPYPGLSQFDLPHSPISATKLTELSSPRWFSGEVYIASLPLNGGNGLSAGSRWQIGVLATLIEQPRWSLSLGAEYGLYAPEVHYETSIDWDESSAQIDADGNQFISFSKVFNTGFGQSLMTSKIGYRPAGDSLDQLDTDRLLLKTTACTQLELLSLPLILRLKFGQGRLKWNLKGGFGAANLIRHSTSMATSVSSSVRQARYEVISSNSSEISDRLEKVFFQCYAGFGVEWRLNHRHSLLLEPTAVFSLSKLSQGNGRTTRPFGIGLQAGVRRRF